MVSSSYTQLRRVSLPKGKSALHIYIYLFYFISSFSSLTLCVSQLGLWSGTVSPDWLPLQTLLLHLENSS